MNQTAELIPSLVAETIQIFQKQFGSPPEIVTSAPGRVEILGNHTDYNGGTVVGAGIGQRLEIGCSLRDDNAIHLHSTDTCQTSLESYASDELSEWCRYPLGVFDELRMLGKTNSERGFNLCVNSDVPVGAGLSSSAALEMAAALALTQLYAEDEGEFAMADLVRISHRAENRYVGIPCGLLDQTVVGYAKADSMIILDASTSRHSVLPTDGEASLVIFRSHISHDLAHSSYDSRHEECRQALMGLSRVIPGIRHLAHLDPIDIKAYDVVLDEKLARRARHVVEEQRRVGAFLKALNEGDHGAAGQLMTASHESSRTLFENSTPELDFLVQQLNAKENVFGARLSGAGWGGAVVALVGKAFSEKEAEEVIDSYEEFFDIRPRWWRSEMCEGVRVDSRA